MHITTEAINEEIKEVTSYLGLICHSVNFSLPILDLQCVAGSGSTSGAHTHTACQKSCHAMSSCASISDDQEEGFGSESVVFGMWS